MASLQAEVPRAAKVAKATSATLKEVLEAERALRVAQTGSVQNGSCPLVLFFANAPSLAEVRESAKMHSNSWELECLEPDRSNG